MVCKHLWCELTTDKYGIPMSYKCIHCLEVYILNKKDISVKEYVISRNKLLFERIEKNNKRIDLLNNLHLSKGVQLVINFLNNENKMLNSYLKVIA